MSPGWMPARYAAEARAIWFTTTPSVRGALSSSAARVSGVTSSSRSIRAAPRRTRQVVHDAAHEVARHREADALIAAALREDRGVDPDQLAARVDQRPARVAGIDRRVGLDEILVRRDADVAAAERADDTQRHGLAERNGLPMASTHSATLSFDESPHGITGRSVASIFSSARSVHESTPTMLARRSRWSPTDTVTSADIVSEHVVVGDDQAVGRDHDA